MDRAALSSVFQKEENENAALSSKNSFQKQRIKNGKKDHHHNIGTKYKNGQQRRKCSQHANNSPMP
jgi:hypothetical protein